MINRNPSAKAGGFFMRDRAMEKPSRNPIARATFA
jgi:hypothetical protein